jgi:UDP-N-acetylmuramate dehydrogenase
MYVKKNIPLSLKNWFSTGGKAAYFINITTIEDLKKALFFAQQNNIPFIILGQGANILVSDKGFPGLIIGQEHFNKVTIDHKSEEITAQAGASLDSVITQALHHNLIGLEVFSGIPGTIGGSIFINVHYFEDFLGNFLKKALILDINSQTTFEVSRDWFNFGYNQSKLHQKQHILLSATFSSLKKSSELDTAYARGKRDEIIRQRNRRYPNSRTCGSFFRNFFPDEVTEINGQKITSIAYYLDKVGVKGVLKEGNVSVSHQHANMIVTKPGASSQDVVNLAKKMQTLVYKNFGIVPQPECQFIGFKECPLLT